MEERAQGVHPACLRHARALDLRYHPQQVAPHAAGPGPVEQTVLNHGVVRGAAFGAYGEWSWDVEWLLEEAARVAARRRRSWRRMGVTSEAIAYGFLVASYRRRMGIVAVREMARHRYRQSQYVGLTRLQLDEIGRERDLQRQGAQQAEARAERAVELAQERVVPAYERL